VYTAAKSATQALRLKQRIYMNKEGIGDYGDEKCYLIRFLNFHGLLGNPQLLTVHRSSVGMHQGVVRDRIGRMEVYITKQVTLLPYFPV
jgi:hypothetical protein